MVGLPGKTPGIEPGQNALAVRRSHARYHRLHGVQAQMFKDRDLRHNDM